MRKSSSKPVARLLVLSLCFMALGSAADAEAADPSERAGLPATSERSEKEMSDDEFMKMLNQYDEKYAEEGQAIADPLKKWNTVWFDSNDKLYFWVLKPVSMGYDKIVPRTVQHGIYNLFDNLTFPRRFINNGLQGLPKQAGVELGRFIINTTVGVLGLWDPADNWLGWKERDADTDQTLGKWKFPMGIYLVWPLIGPSSVRGSFGGIVDMALNPTTYLPGGSILNEINTTSLGENPYESIVDMAVDPYVAVRNAYVQNHEKKIEE
jgi:phospholipid-binding lipoprotein MlaA